MWCFKINRAPATIPKTVGMVFGMFIAAMTLSLPVYAKGKQEPSFAKEYFELAQAYAETAKYDKAITFYLKAAADPAHKNAAEYNLARVYGLQGDWQKARAILERQYAEAPDNMLILTAFAYALAASGDTDRACEMYRNIYERDTETPETALNYVRILITAKRYDEATSSITALKQRFTENAEREALDMLEEKIKKALEPPAEKTETPPSGSKEQKATPDKAAPDEKEPLPNEKAPT